MEYHGNMLTHLIGLEPFEKQIHDIARTKREHSFMYYKEIGGTHCEQKSELNTKHVHYFRIT